VIRRRGLRISVAHRLTPTATLVLSADAQRTEGDLASLRTTLRSYAIGWNDQLGPRSDLSLGVKHASFDSTTQPYEATTVTTVLRVRF
jgi:uncharacterized protein (PEP-CTERM system associated)